MNEYIITVDLSINKLIVFFQSSYLGFKLDRSQTILNMHKLFLFDHTEDFKSAHDLIQNKVLEAPDYFFSQVYDIQKPYSMISVEAIHDEYKHLSLTTTNLICELLYIYFKGEINILLNEQSTILPLKEWKSKYR